MAVLDSSRQALSIDPLSGSIGILRKVIQQKLHLGFPSSNRQMLTSWPVKSGKMGKKLFFTYLLVYAPIINDLSDFHIPPPIIVKS